MSTVVKLTLTPRIGARRLLVGIASASAYLSTVIEQRAGEWRGAHDYLLEQGWTPARIRDAVEAAGPLPDFAPDLRRILAREIHEQVSEAAARALAVLAREISAGNTVAARALGLERYQGAEIKNGR